MSNKNANIGARLDRLPNSGWHIKMWLVSAFALLVCWSNGIGGAVQNVLLNELHWLEPGSTLLAMWGTTYTAGQLFGALVGGPLGDKIGRKYVIWGSILGVAPFSMLMPYVGLPATMVLSFLIGFILSSASCLPLKKLIPPAKSTAANPIGEAFSSGCSRETLYPGT
jgi:MFS family permease